jgi:hypothetical protein
MSDSDLDELYWAKPDAFIALRTTLSSAAKRRGDREAARRISVTNKPTTAAWVVNRLVIGRREARQRLADLGDRLRAAHAAMDGDQIRDLSAEQRKLIDELTRAAFEAAELSNPSGAVRDDVGATLQAAIADPDIRSALGRLTRPERWSGFGAFGDAPSVVGIRGGKRTSRPGQPNARPTSKKPDADARAAGGHTAVRERENQLRAAREQREKLEAAVAVAERARSEADETLSERRAGLAEARSALEQARQRLRAAERDLEIAEQAYGEAQQASRDAAELVREAKAQLKRARSNSVKAQAAVARRPGRHARSGH